MPGNNWELAVHVLDSMFVDKIPPDIICYNAVARFDFDCRGFAFFDF